MIEALPTEEFSMPPRAAPRSMKTASPPWTRGDFRGVGTVTENLVEVVDPETHPALRDRCRFGEGFSSLHPLRGTGFSREGQIS